MENSENLNASAKVPLDSHSVALLTRVGHALSDPTRARVMLTLSLRPSFPSQLAEECGVSRQIMSNHLACLRGCGIVTVTRDGRSLQYKLANQELAAAIQYLTEVALAGPITCCEGGVCSC